MLDLMYIYIIIMVMNKLYTNNKNIIQMIVFELILLMIQLHLIYILSIYYYIEKICHYKY